MLIFHLPSRTALLSKISALKSIASSSKLSPPEKTWHLPFRIRIMIFSGSMSAIFRDWPPCPDLAVLKKSSKSLSVAVL